MASKCKEGQTLQDFCGLRGESEEGGVGFVMQERKIKVARICCRLWWR